MNRPVPRVRRVGAVIAGAWTALVAAGVLPVVRAQDEPVEARLVRVAGLDADGAGQFFDALRRNVGTGDRAAACAMIAYPLRHPGGDVSDAGACVARYEEIFTIPVRRAVGRQQWKELFVSERGVAVGAGELWFGARCQRPPCQASEIRITAINVEPGLKPPQGKVLIACAVSGQAVRLSADGAGGAELRVWQTSSPTGEPAIVLRSGTPTAEAVNLCAWRAWSFAGPPSYVVAEVGCMANPVPAPMGTVARVTRVLPGRAEEAGWCFE